jgi:hypothetical protein
MRLLFREVVMSDAKPPAAGASPIVADLGRRGRKAIKQLRKGRGPLLEDAQKVVEQLRADRAITDGAQPVIVIVKERRRRYGMFP